MEAFSLLKYWRGGGGGGAAMDSGANVRSGTAGATTIVTAVPHQAAETDDDGPFFDLEFGLPDEDEREEQEKLEDNGCANSIDGGDDTDSDGTEGEDEKEFRFTLSSRSSGDRTDPNASLSPSDDLFFKGRLVPIEQSSIVFNGSETNAKSQFSLLKSATKFRVMMLKLKKSKANVAEKTEPVGPTPATAKQHQKQEESQQQKNQPQSKPFTVKFKVEEVPLVSLFTRDNSSRAFSGGYKSQKQQQQSSDESAPDEKRFSKDAMQRYLNKVKPSYIRASKRYGEKLSFSGQISSAKAKGEAPRPPPAAEQDLPPSKMSVAKSEPKPAEKVEPPTPPPPSNVQSLKQGNLPAGLRVVCKHLGKSRSASSSVAAAPSGSAQTRRRDDSLLQQQDGIQSAILHCKRSFNASRDSESSLFSRSAGDSSYGESTKNCSGDPKETGK